MNLKLALKISICSGLWFLASVLPAVHGAPAARELCSGERAAIAAHAAGSLAELRAGAALPPAKLDGGERDALRSAAQSAPELRALRAGDLHLSDRELTIIAIAVVATLILVAIA